MLKKVTFRILVSLALAGMPLGAMAQTSDPAWLDTVRQQAAEIESCDVTYFLNINESELGGKRLYEARVQCADGRMFDASRIEPATEFEFRACQIQVC